MQVLAIRQQVNRMKAGRAHRDPLTLDNTSAYGNVVVIMLASHHCEKCQLKDSRSHWYRSIAIRQQDSLRTFGHTHTGSTK